MRTLNLQSFDVHPQLSSGCDRRRHWQHWDHYVMNWKSTTATKKKTSDE
jgi:hypothetical protein